MFRRWSELYFGAFCGAFDVNQNLQSIGSGALKKRYDGDGRRGDLSPCPKVGHISAT